MPMRRRLLLGFALMLVPVLLVAGAAIRTNALERDALGALGAGMARTRTFSELEGALQAQAEVLWRALASRDPGARREDAVTREVVDTWEARWRDELRPDEVPALPARIAVVRRELDGVAESLFARLETGRHEEAWVVAQRELRGRVVPGMNAVTRGIYGDLRQTSVRATFARLEEILAAERRSLGVVLALALATGVAASWWIAGTIARPLAGLAAAMDTIGRGRLDAAIPAGGDDEIGRLATAFARMRDNLRDAQARVVQAEKLASIGEMSAAVAHGLRNPLAGLRASAQLALRQQPGTPAFRETLDGMITEVDRLDRRISHLLAFSRPAAAHPIADRPAALVAGVLPAFAEQLRARGIACEADVADDLPAVRVDPRQVEQALVEVLSNAMQATPDGGRITVRARADAPPRRVLIEVADTGPGIPADVLPQVCDPFFTTRPEGTGLGLAAARRFVEQSGGTLALASAPGAGTTVTLALPVAGDDP